MNLILAYLPYAFITAYTPGPNNILALNNVSRKGLKKGKMTLFGIAAGFFCVMVICAIGCMELSRLLPKFTNAMKYIGMVYILWLALHIFLSRPTADEKIQNSDFLTSFLLQFMNVKIILYAITIYTVYIIPYSDSKLLLATSVICNTLIGMSGNIVWAFAGQLLQKQFAKHFRLFNSAMALILLWCALHMII